MASDDESASQEIESAALESEKYLNSVCEVDAIQNASIAEQNNTSTDDSRNAILNVKKNTNEKCQSFLDNSPFETIYIKEEELKKVNLDEYLHLKSVTSSGEDCNENPLGTCQNLEKSEQHSDEIKSVENEISNAMLGNEIHPECLQEKQFLIPHLISSSEHNVGVLCIRAANDAAHNTPRSLGVWKPIINKSSVGKTNKIVKTDLNVQSPGPRCIGSRITKTPYRKKSPLNWFPRKKTESFLERKIRMLQEAEGIKASLDETLVGSNIILPRVEREKRAVQAVAKEAIKTRKAAFVEASWCRILVAAGIPCGLAAEELKKAETKASEVLDKAVALGVIMKSNPSTSNHSCEGGSPNNEEGLSNTITASFETAFEVDKEVSAAVKVAFRRLSQLSDSTLGVKAADKCKSRICNGDALGLACIDESEILEGLDEKTGLHEGCFETNTQHDSELKGEKDTRTKHEAGKLPLGNKIFKEIPSNLEASEDLVKLMVERMKFLSTKELISLEQVVSTRGLGALLQEQNVEVKDKNSGCGLADILVKHVSRLEAEKAAASKSTVLSRASKKKICQENVPDLGSVLVKHKSKLEKEIAEAKKSYKGEELRCRQQSGQIVESLDKVLVKRVSVLERNKQEAAAKGMTLEDKKATKSIRSCTNEHSTLGLGDILKKQDSTMKNNFFKGFANRKENKDANMIGDTLFDEIKQTNIGKKESKEQVESLDKILIKRVSRLEKEKAAAIAFAKAHDEQRNLASTNSEINFFDGPDVCNHRRNAQDNTNDYASQYREDCVTSAVEKPVFIQSGNIHNVENILQHNSSSVSIPDLGSVLIKRVPKFQQEIEAAKRASTTSQSIWRKERFHNEKSEEGLDKVLVKHVSRLEREKLAVCNREISRNVCATSTASSGELEGQHPDRSGENQIQSNGVFIPEYTELCTKPDAKIQGLCSEISHLSYAKSNQLKQGNDNITGTSKTNPFPAPIKKMSRLEIEKQEAAALAASGNNPWQRRRNTRDQELQSIWGGVGLGNVLKPHMSKLKLEQAAWRKAEEEEKSQPPSH
ncbi:hypothetical protein SUGI_0956190 [Cryptomeria japonica]|uniref:uncharacterized protein LOC131062891 n=1 Tax=Cryptomeria japonica TaxID=3369 RepID=UPI002414B56E|nr:uncharacterized protein LOC131062891 [Cryptomeria japonica]XP_057852613.2 uncharacterized protein LOC131062891 [Cryptomeria japonica]GLJ45418.1 hypothetical protein SUGI_0956190 [Cryptomeria japonica]